MPRRAEILKAASGLALVVALLLAYRAAMKHERERVRPPSMASEAIVRGSQDRWRSFLVIKTPTLVQISRTDRVCKDGRCSFADGIDPPQRGRLTVFQDPAQSQVLDGPPGPYRALLARACSHANNVEFCSKTIAPGFRFAACVLNWELQLWTNAFASTDTAASDFEGATGGYAFEAFASDPTAIAACGTGPTFVVALPDSP